MIRFFSKIVTDPKILGLNIKLPAERALPNLKNININKSKFLYSNPCLKKPLKPEERQWLDEIEHGNSDNVPKKTKQ